MHWGLCKLTNRVRALKALQDCSSGDETTEIAPTQLKCDGYTYIYIPILVAAVACSK